jgi:hypothetical protein
VQRLIAGRDQSHVRTNDGRQRKDAAR